MKNYIEPEWPAPKNVKAYFSTRNGGCSAEPYHSLNLGDHVDDAIENVIANRQYLNKLLALPNEPAWLQQVHGNNIIDAADWQTNIIADGSFTSKKNLVCAVMTADCLPILLCNRAGTQVMALHGGWRSLAANIIKNGIALFNCDPKEILVWLGPAIGPEVYEIGNEVRDEFLKNDPQLEIAFIPSPQNRWLMNIYAIAKIKFSQEGVINIFGGEHCTFTESQLFFSYRRDGKTGRMAGLIYFV